jgi:hypothetical protein
MGSTSVGRAPYMPALPMTCWEGPTNGSFRYISDLQRIILYDRVGSTPAKSYIESVR